MFSFDLSFVKTLVLKILPIASDEVLFEVLDSIGYENVSIKQLGIDGVTKYYVRFEKIGRMEENLLCFWKTCSLQRHRVSC